MDSAWKFGRKISPIFFLRCLVPAFIFANLEISLKEDDFDAGGPKVQFVTFFVLFPAFFSPGGDFRRQKKRKITFFNCKSRGNRILINCDSPNFSIYDAGGFEITEKDTFE